MRIANLPEAVFEAAVECGRPPAISMLLELGQAVDNRANDHRRREELRERSAEWHEHFRAEMEGRQQTAANARATLVALLAELCDQEQFGTVAQLVGTVAMGGAIEVSRLARDIQEAAARMEPDNADL